MQKGVLRITLTLATLAAPAAALAGGSYPPGAVHAWFDQLRSEKGLCCSFADGLTLSDVEWGIEGGHYWVIVEGQKLFVPPDALVGERNRYGTSVVWPYKDEKGAINIRCFMPGSLS